MFLADVETRVAARSWAYGERDQLGFARQARNIKPIDTDRPFGDGCKCKGES
jgi:hypothetical protein